jgi:hypothetical protein
MPPPTRTLQEAIEYVKHQFPAGVEKKQPVDMRLGQAREHGYEVGSRGRLPSDVAAAYQNTQE